MADKRKEDHKERRNPNYEYLTVLMNEANTVPTRELRKSPQEIMEKDGWELIETNTSSHATNTGPLVGHFRRPLK